MWGYEFTSKDAALQGGVIVVLRPMPAAPRMYLIVVYRQLPAAPLAVRCMYMAVVPEPKPAAGSFAVLSKQVSTVGLHLRLAVPRPMPAAVASRCCRRRLKQFACTCGTIGCGVWQHA